MFRKLDGSDTAYYRFRIYNFSHACCEHYRSWLVSQLHDFSPVTPGQDNSIISISLFYFFYLYNYFTYKAYLQCAYTHLVHSMPPRIHHVPFRSITPARRFTQHSRLSHGVDKVVPDWVEAETGEKSAETQLPGGRLDIHMTRRIFSGIQPTGVPHLGNYLGALRQWKYFHDLSTEDGRNTGVFPDQLYSIVDLHALTSSVPPRQLLSMRKESYASLLAMGLENNHRTAVFFQSDVRYSVAVQNATV